MLMSYILGMIVIYTNAMVGNRKTIIVLLILIVCFGVGVYIYLNYIDQGDDQEILPPPITITTNGHEDSPVRRLLTCGDGQCVKGENVQSCPADCIAPIRPAQSPVIASVYLETENPLIFNGRDSSGHQDTQGDLWFSTWANNDKLYMSWGDGSGFDSKEGTDLGIAEITGRLPNIKGTNIFFDPLVANPDCAGLNCKVPNEEKPTCCLSGDDKPSSLLYVNNKLYAQIHSPLGDSNVGYIAVSEDKGKTWTRYKENSPWTKRANSNFRSMFFINMGKNYNLNTDGYVYAYGIGKEWMWEGGVYLARVKKEDITNYNAYSYFSGMNGQAPIWSAKQNEAKPVQADLILDEQFSVIYHPGIGRYLIMSQFLVYDSPTPWGPWTTAGTWVKDGWFGYQPGMISKNMGDNSFWFTIAGQPPGHDISYKLNLGKIVMELK